MSRFSLIVLGLMLAGLQYRLWFADGGVAHTHRLQAQVAAQAVDTERLQARNAALDAEVRDLQGGVEALEARARETLGMIRRNETFYLIVSN